MEHEVWTVIDKEEYKRIKKFLSEKFGSPRKSKRLALRFGFNNSHNVNTRIRITDGKATITQKVSQKKDDLIVSAEEIEMELKNDPNEILKIANFFRNILKSAEGSHFYLIQFDNFLWEAEGYEIKLTHQTGNSEVFSYEIELLENEIENAESRLREIAQNLGLNADFTSKDDKFWTEYNKKVNIDILFWDDKDILREIKKYLEK